MANEDCTGGYQCLNGAINFIECAMVGEYQLLFDESISNCNWPQMVAQCVSSCPVEDPPTSPPDDTPSSVPSSAPSGAPECPFGTDNLGPLLSASDFQGNFTTLAESFNVFNPVGRESQLSVLIGGDYNGPLASEIEGRVVVLGDFNIGPNGISSIGTYRRGLSVLLCV